MEKNPIDTLREITMFWEHIISSYRYCEQRINELNNHTTDLLHEVELESEYDNNDACYYYHQLRAVRIERRERKNEMEILKPLYDWFVSNQPMKAKLSQIQGAMSATVERQEIRIYTPRAAALPGREILAGFNLDIPGDIDQAQDKSMGGNQS